MRQPACPLPLCDLAGSAPLAPNHQDTPQHEECHQGEGPHIPPSLGTMTVSVICHQDPVLRLVYRDGSHWGTQTGQGARHPAPTQWASWAPLFLTPRSQSIHPQVPRARLASHISDLITPQNLTTPTWPKLPCVSPGRPHHFSQPRAVLHTANRIE